MSGGLRVGGWGLMVASGVASAYVGIWDWVSGEGF